MIPLPKNAPSKSPNDQLQPQISKLYRKYLCLPKRLSYWPSGFYEEFQERYFLHSNSPILWQSVTKIIEKIFLRKSSKKNVRFAQRYPEFLLLLIQCCAKFGKAIPGSVSQEWPSKPATNNE